MSKDVYEETKTSRSEQSMKSLAKNSLVNLIYTVLDFACVLIRAVYAGRILLAEGVGQVSYIQSIAGYFLAFAQLGLPVYGLREIAKVREKASETGKIFTELFRMNLLSTSCALLAYFLLAPQVVGVREQWGLFLIFGLNIFCNYFNVDWLYQGQEEYVFIAIRNISVKLLSFVAMFCFVRTEKDYMQYALICCLESGCNYVLDLVWIRRYLKPVRKGLTYRRHVKPLLILAVGTLFTTLYSKIDITMLGALSTKAATGYYSYANTALSALTAACLAILSVFFPRLSYFYQKDRDEFHRLLQLGMKAQMFFCIPVSACVFILAPQIVKILFGNAFLPAAETIRILAVLIAIQSFANLIGYQVLMATGNEKEQIRAFIMAVIVNVALNAFMIPMWANNGAAVASVISEIFVNVYKIYRVYRKVPFKIPWKAFGQALVSTALMTMAMLAVVQVEMMPFWQCLVAVTGGVGVYTIVNMLMRNEWMMGIISSLETRIRQN